MGSSVPLYLRACIPAYLHFPPCARLQTTLASPRERTTPSRSPRFCRRQAPRCTSRLLQEKASADPARPCSPLSPIPPRAPKPALSPAKTSTFPSREAVEGWRREDIEGVGEEQTWGRSGELEPPVADERARAPPGTAGRNRARGRRWASDLDVTTGRASSIPAAGTDVPRYRSSTTPLAPLLLHHPKRAPSTAWPCLGRPSLEGTKEGSSFASMLHGGGEEGRVETHLELNWSSPCSIGAISMLDLTFARAIGLESTATGLKSAASSSIWKARVR
ncbi:unnamed protein product [Urochloa humidicola]